MLLNRELEASLRSWLQNDKRKPVIIRGARQVGKSTLIRKLARDQGYTLFELNLEKHISLNDIFATFDLKTIMAEIEGIFSQKISKGDKVLLFFDEIQATPAALAALRYFYEELPWLPVIAAGSLLEFALAKFSYSMPVGRIEYRYLGPLRFHEFLQALNETYLLECISDLREKGISLASHNKLLQRQREFLFVGGMPEVVVEFITSGNINRCLGLQGNLLATLEDDFSKYATGSKLQRLRRVFAKTPSLIGKKVKYSHISKEEKSREVKSALNQLIMAQLCHPVYHSDGTGLPLGVNQEFETYKLLYLDVGLMAKTLGLNWSEFNSIDDVRLINEGAIAEQFIGQELLYRFRGLEKPQLHYFLRDGKMNNAEVDYLITDNKNVLPIEVKAGKSGTLRSLQLFANLRKTPRALRFDLNMPSTQEIKTDNGFFTLESLPLYAVSVLSE